MISKSEAGVIARAERDPAYCGAQEVRVLLDVIRREIKDAKAFADKVGELTKTATAPTP